MKLKLFLKCIGIISISVLLQSYTLKTYPTKLTNSSNAVATEDVSNSVSKNTDANYSNSFVAPIAPYANNILYVNKNASSSDGNDTKWANVITELADALLWAENNPNTSWATAPIWI